MRMMILKYCGRAAELGSVGTTMAFGPLNDTLSLGARWERKDKNHYER